MTRDQLLRKVFGLSTLRSEQEMVLDAMEEGKDVLAVMPTGAGKSLCYQLPAYLYGGVVLIVTPLISLMEDQVRRLWHVKERSVVALHSGMAWREKQLVLHRLASYRFVFVSPEMLQTKKVKEALMSCTIRLFVVDEAHCISQWGPEFRLDYLKLGEVRETLGSPPCLALTATAPTAVVHDIVTHLRFSTHQTILRMGTDRPNIRLAAQTFDHEFDKKEALLTWIKRMRGPALVYVSSRRKAEELALLLEKETAFEVSAYHAGLNPEERQLIQRQFLHNELEVVVCTSAFGMGIDKPDIQFVLHYHMPSRIESFVQEMGRAGRDGRPAFAVGLFSPEDELLQQHLMTGSLPDDAKVDRLYLCFCQLGWREGMSALKQHDHRFDMSEEQMDYCYFQLQRLESAEEDPFAVLKNLAQERLREKWSHWKCVKKWIFTEGCRRQELLDAFDETLEPSERPQLCCDNCGMTVPLVRSQAAVVTPLQPQAVNDWRQELAVICQVSQDEAGV
ncbi:RecQ family ATP-dependent DNA helicase [Bacillaceae bacterium SIJ1]|uniref:RecQ family ATP-dependent DNA helicase n=1 Tax=Litoribacterium kuwaitense TaxID=1398745 RepID=UPI0013ED6808|nr:RecQ family ATP-dependent DNA helicase [Litoribacterium kuwaitense]NGP43677.1 RecQ family ATP-dependent DNA helicase [Litoribacterium kuwaitense]